jgi:hypothetical protein
MLLFELSTVFCVMLDNVGIGCVLERLKILYCIYVSVLLPLVRVASDAYPGPYVLGL